MIPRSVGSAVLAALSDTPVVFLAGARQVGKSTLVQHLGRTAHPASYVTFDDLTTLAAARADPGGFLAGLSGNLILDEIQRAPELLLPIKAAVDRHRASGRFLLTGSANVLALPRVAESLAGRMEVITLWPLSQGELGGIRETFVDLIFGEPAPTPAGPPLSRRELAGRIVRGGYPEATARIAADRRAAWYEAYVSTLVHRDVRDLANIEALTDLPRVLSLIAARTGGLANYADLGRSASIPQTTLKRYLGLLEALYLVHRLPAWSANLSARLAKAPKLLPVDTGLAAHLLGVDAEGLAGNPQLFGQLLEAFVANEVTRQTGWSKVRPHLAHFRTHGGKEVDLVLEDRRGRLVAIEVKAGATVGTSDIAGIRAFADLVGKRFHSGIVLNTGAEAVPFAARIHALPVWSLWRWGAPVADEGLA